MPRENFVLKTLLEKGEVTFKPYGNSMTGKINSGDQAVVKQVPVYALRVGDSAINHIKGLVGLPSLSVILPNAQ
jgi:hypothetical protein